MHSLEEDSFTMFHVGDRLPVAYAGSAGSRGFLELCPDFSLNLIINSPRMSARQRAQFGQGIGSYSYLELGSDVPVALWHFSFGEGKKLLIGASFDGRALAERGMGGILDRYLAARSDVLNVFVAGNCIVKDVWLAGLSQDAVDRFKQTLKAQLGKNYSHADFQRALVDIEQSYSVEEIVSFGRRYKMRGQEAPEQTAKEDDVTLGGSFPLGQIFATPGVLHTVATEYIDDCLLRHERGDWGCIPRHDIVENEKALVGGWRLMSAYPIDPTRVSRGYGANTIWVITEADRSRTTVLLPNEY
jgi:hypothetical protein